MVLNQKAIRTLALVSVAASAVTGLGQKPGDLVVTPTRLSLSTTSKAGDVTLLNRGNETVRYRLSFVDMAMSEDGVLQRSGSKPEFSGTEIFRFSPREIVLQPGESQRIKILTVFPDGAKDGEYRSHLAFDPIAIRKPASISNTDSQQLSLKLEIRSAITIPVIARKGAVSASAALSDAAVVREGSGWLARFRLNRSGNRSIRGDVAVSFLPADGGKAVPLGVIASLPVYFPNQHRNVSVKLNQDVAALGKGQVQVRFTESEVPKGMQSVKTVLIPRG